MTSIQEFEKRFQELRRKFQAGRLSAEQFQAEVERLQFRDVSGRCWMIGSRSGQWYCYDGTRWVPGQPSQACPRCGQIVPLGAMACGVCGYPGPAPAAPPLQQKRPKEFPTWLLAGCAALIVAGMMVAALSIGVMGMALLGPEPLPPSPTRASIVPIPELATSTPAPPPHLVLAPSPTAILSSNLEDLIKKGDELTFKSRFEEAIANYKRAVEMKPSEASAYAHWARALYLQYWNHVDEALAKALIAAKLAPKSAEVLAQLARCYAWNGQPEEAIKAAQEAIKLDPSLADAHAFLAEAYFADERFEDASREIEKALELDTKNAEAHRSKAYLLLRQGRNEEALEEFQMVAELQPELALRYYELGLHYQRLGLQNKAIAEFEKAIRLDQNFAWAYNGLGRSYYDGRGDGEKALTYLEKALELDPEFAPAHYNLGFVKALVEGCQEAIPAFQMALKLDPTMKEAQDGLSRCEQGLPLAEPTLPPTPTSVIVEAKPTPKPPSAPPPPKPVPEQPPPQPQPEQPPAEGGEGTPSLTGHIAYPVFYNDQGSYDIFLADLSSGGHGFFIGQASTPDLSSDGRYIAYRSWKGDARGVIAMAISGMDFKKLTSQAFFEDARPCWSHDGGSVVFFSRRESDRQARIYVYDMGEKSERNLGVIGTNPDWLPDGRIIYQGCIPEGCGIIAMNRDGSGPKLITTDGRDSSPSASPDGSKVAFMSQRDGSWDIYVVNVDGTGLARLTESHGQDGLPDWSPDGKSIAFVSDHTGRWSLWVMNADGSDQKELFTIEGSGVDGIVRGKPDWESRGWLEEHISWEK
ncbi:MAG: tetratricopeptide repeat protein [Anaerolineae bacterium]